MSKLFQHLHKIYSKRHSIAGVQKSGQPEKLFICGEGGGVK